MHVEADSLGQQPMYIPWVWCGLGSIWGRMQQQRRSRDGSGWSSMWTRGMRVGC